MFLKISENSQKNTGVGVFFLNKVSVFKAASLLKKKLQLRYFPVNFATLLATSILGNTSGQMTVFSKKLTLIILKMDSFASEEDNIVRLSKHQLSYKKTKYNIAMSK